jgi:hypothetical protein
MQERSALYGLVLTYVYVCVIVGVFQHVVREKFTEVSFHKGDRIQNLTDKVRFDPRIVIKDCYFILIMMGTNDLSHLVSTGLIKSVTVQHLMQEYEALNQVICRLNRHATLIFSAILPWADNFDLFFPLVFWSKFCILEVVSEVSWQMGIYYYYITYYDWFVFLL